MELDIAIALSIWLVLYFPGFCFHGLRRRTYPGTVARFSFSWVRPAHLPRKMVQAHLPRKMVLPAFPLERAFPTCNRSASDSAIDDSAGPPRPNMACWGSGGGGGDVRTPLDPPRLPPTSGPRRTPKDVTGQTCHRHTSHAQTRQEELRHGQTRHRETRHERT